ERLGFASGQVVQEIGRGEDSDAALREAIETRTGTKLVDDEHDGLVDAVLYWWRAQNGDLAEELNTAALSLHDGGFIWLLTPKPDRHGHIAPSDLGEEIVHAGLKHDTPVSAAPDWTGTRVTSG
ncbi:DUF3052 domain-containing protein, partial [Streptomyces rubiginosohelvolus]